MMRKKIGIFLYIIATLMGSLTIAVMAIVASNAIEFLVLNSYRKSIQFFIITVLICVLSTFCWFISSIIYYKTGCN